MNYVVVVFCEITFCHQKGDGSLIDTSHLIGTVQKVLMKIQQDIQNLDNFYWTIHYHHQTFQVPKI